MEAVKVINQADNFLGEKSLTLSKINSYYVVNYLSEVKKRSDGAYRNQKWAIKQLLDSVNKSVIEITKLDIYNYFKNVLDQKLIKEDSKNAIRSYLKSFFDYIEAILLDQNINYQNPIVSRRVFRFTKRDEDIKKQSDARDKVIPKDKLRRILNYCKTNYYYSKKIFNMRHFIFYSLAACTGARKAEIMTIKLKDVNLDERYFETGFVKNARKSTGRTGKSLLFFFPAKFVPYLENYMIKLKEMGCKWLFPARRNPQEGYWSRGSIVYSYTKIRKKLGIHFTMHFFRHSLITYLDENGCSEDKLEGLLNHEPSSIQRKFYKHLTIEKKRDIYDQFFPYKGLVPYF